MSRAEIRQGKAEHFVPEVYIAGANAEVAAAVGKRVAALQARWPGLTTVQSGPDIRMVVPEKFRVGHEEHFGQVTNHFFEVRDVAQVASGAGDSLHAGQVCGIHQGCGEGETMKTLLLILAVAMTAAGAGEPP